MSETSRPPSLSMFVTAFAAVPPPCALEGYLPKRNACTFFLQVFECVVLKECDLHGSVRFQVVGCGWAISLCGDAPQVQPHHCLSPCPAFLPEPADLNAERAL